MELELIPLPISILFVIVLGLVCMAVLFKLRRKGKVYSVLLRVSLIIIIFLLIALLYSTVIGIFS